jgi:hypothetical protein
VKEANNKKIMYECINSKCSEQANL